MPQNQRPGIWAKPIIPDSGLCAFCAASRMKSVVKAGSRSAGHLDAGLSATSARKVVPTGPGADRDGEERVVVHTRAADRAGQEVIDVIAGVGQLGVRTCGISGSRKPAAAYSASHITSTA
jgi:hypothetical protein